MLIPVDRRAPVTTSTIATIQRVNFQAKIDFSLPLPSRKHPASEKYCAWYFLEIFPNVRILLQLHRCYTNSKGISICPLGASMFSSSERQAHVISAQANEQKIAI